MENWNAIVVQSHIDSNLTCVSISMIGKIDILLYEIELSESLFFCEFCIGLIFLNFD